MNENQYTQFISDLYVDQGRELTKLASEEWLEIGGKYGFKAVFDIVKAIRQNPDHDGFLRVHHVERAIQGTTKNKTSVAWSKVMSVIDRCSAYNFCFDDPLIHLSIEAMGGWPAVCEWRTEEFGFKENEFSRHYETFSKMSVLPDYPHILNISGNDRSPLIPVGDEELCKLVYKKQHKLLIGDRDGKRLGDK
jgi:hypothetical protein